MEENKHKAIFKGETTRKVYYAHKFFNDYILLDRCEHIEWKEIHDCDMDRPLIEVNEEVYINELNKEVRVNRRIRTTNGEVIYFINDYEIINDELTNKSKEEALSEIARSHEEYKLKKLKEQREIDNKKENKKWWKFGL